LHYNFVFDTLTNSYIFATKNSILYRILFVADSTLETAARKEIPNVFQLVINKESNEIEPYDPKVSRTVEIIIEHFFQNIQNSVLYICDNEEEKAETRYKIFDNWYKKSEFKKYVSKINNIIEVDNIVMYTSFLIRNENPDFNELVEIYMQIGKSLNRK